MPDAPRLSPKQLASVRDSQGRVNLYHGSIRAGKTIGSLLRWLMFCAAALDSSGDLVMFGRTRDSVWRNCIGPMQDPNLFGPLADHVKGNYGAPTVTILGRRVYVIGAHDVQAELVLRGLTVLGAYGDEVTTVPEQFFMQMLGRMSTPQSRLFGTTNPEGPQHWLKKLIDRQLPDWRVFHFTIDDNPSLLPAYVESIKREYTGLWYKRFILGLWVQAEGAIYQSWDDAKHVVPHNQLPTMARILSLGIDFGTRENTRGILAGLSLDPVPRLYLLDEWAPATMTEAGYSLDLRGWMRERPQPEWLYVDPAAASFKLQLFTDQVPNVADATNDVLAGIRTVDSLLATDRLRVSDRCTNLVREIPGYVWDDKAAKAGLDKPVKRDDHACFVAGTMIEAATGPRPIEQVRPGDAVWTRGGLRRVAEAGMTAEAADVFTVELSNGATLTGTGNHPVWVVGKGWIRLDALRYADTTATPSRKPAPVHVVRVAAGGTAPVFNLTVEGRPEYFANGVLVHNCDAARYALHSTRPIWQAYLPMLTLPEEAT